MVDMEWTPVVTTLLDTGADTLITELETEPADTLVTVTLLLTALSLSRDMI